MDLLQTVCRRAVLSSTRPSLLPSSVQTIRNPSSSLRNFSTTHATLNARRPPSGMDRLRQSLRHRPQGEQSSSLLPPRPPPAPMEDLAGVIRADADASLRTFETAEFYEKHSLVEKEVELRLVPQTGRTVNVHRGDPARALRTLESLVKRNNVKREVQLQKFHERPALKRKRQKRERWRKRFGEGVRAAISRTINLKGQGW